MMNERGNATLSSFSKLYILLKDYPTFNLENAVCNHGFFMMAPNVWDPSTKTFTRPLRLADSVNSVNVTISQPHQCNFLLIKVHDMDCVPYLDKQAILAQVSRMMRLSTKDENDVQEFHKIYPEAKKMGFGRIFRSPSLFEDAVKSILLCFCSWQNTLMMAKNLCDLQFDFTNGLILPAAGKDQNSCSSTQGKGLKRKRYFPASSGKVVIQSVRNFPSAKELAALDVQILKDYCKMGFRANHIHEFAKDVQRGKYRLSNFEKCTSHKELHQKILKIKGFGAFVSTNVLMCLGFYENLPIDTETRRHLQEVHGRKDCTARKAKAITKDIYGRFAPFQCLAFWFELARYYESKLGKLSKIPSSRYAFVTGSQCGMRSSEENE